MGRLWAGFVAAVLLIASPCDAFAGGLALSGNTRWIVLASRPDLGAAIGVARYHRWQFPSVRVMRAANAWFAVVAGPENATDPRALRQRLARTGGLPSDFIFSRGDSYVEQVWTPPPSLSGPSAKYDGKHDSILRVGSLSVLLGSARGKDGDRHPVAVGREDGQAAFAMSLDQSTRGTDDDSSTDFAEATALRLDPISPRLSVVFISFWGGAHCCTVTKIATQDSRTGRWSVADGETLDSGGYAFEDLDGDGSYELLNGDNSFLYAFGPYASSNPPAQIHWLRAGRLEDVTRHVTFAGYQRQRLAGMEQALAGGDFLGQ
jgi:serine protease Do